MDEISSSLSKFNVQVEHFEQWYADLIDQLESRDLNKLSHEEFAMKIDQFITKREKQRNHFDEMINNGKNLIAKKDVTDVGVVREKIKVIRMIRKKKLKYLVLILNFFFPPQILGIREPVERFEYQFGGKTESISCKG